MVLTKEEQECKPLLSSPSSKSSDSSAAADARKAAKARSALLLKDNLHQMHKQPLDAVSQHLLKVGWLWYKQRLVVVWSRGTSIGRIRQHTTRTAQLFTYLITDSLCHAHAHSLLCLNFT